MILAISPGPLPGFSLVAVLNLRVAYFGQYRWPLDHFKPEWQFELEPGAAQTIRILRRVATQYFRVGFYRSLMISA
jgi:hypothetical protein